jgi:hypothetical protein
MKVRLETRRGLAPIAGALGVAALLALSGCASKVTRVDASYVSPEGTPSANTSLVVFEDREVLSYVYLDFSPPGPDPGDVLSDVVSYRRGTPGMVHGMIADGTAASGFQVFRTEAGGGTRQLLDYPTVPKHRWLDTGWELYAFSDGAPTTDPKPTYQCRGLIEDAATVNSPLSNRGILSDTSLVNLHLRVIHELPPAYYTDSLFTVTWDAVPKTAYYTLQVYTLRGDLRSEPERIVAAAPAPFFDGKADDIYSVLVAGNKTSYKLETPALRLLTRRRTFYDKDYLARVAAIDSSGRMIGFSFGDMRIGPAEDGYTLQSLGAIVVQTQKLPPSSGATRSRIEPPLSARVPGRSAEIVTLGEGPDAIRVLHFE